MFEYLFEHDNMSVCALENILLEVDVNCIKSEQIVTLSFTIRCVIMLTWYVVSALNW